MGTNISIDFGGTRSSLVDRRQQQSTATVDSHPEEQTGKTVSFLLELPEEILLRIMEVNYPQRRRYTPRKSRNRDLRHLSLTCRKLCRIAQEALFTSSDVPKGKMLPYILALCQRPDLAAKVQELSHDEFLPSCVRPSRGEIENWISITRYVYGIDFRPVNAAIAKSQKINYRQELSITALLFTKAPNLKRLFLDNSGRRSISWGKDRVLFPMYPRYQSLWSKSVVDELYKSLEEVYIDDQIRVRSFRDCQNLKRIRMPVDHYMPNSIPPPRMFPRSSERLYFDFRTALDMWWVRFLDSVIVNKKYFPYLETVEISGLEYLFRHISELHSRRKKGIEYEWDRWNRWDKMREIIETWVSSPVAVRFHVEAGKGLIGTGSFPYDRYLTCQSLLEMVDEFLQGAPGDNRLA
ncbi:hypothetical protein DM02DRAFT_658958 [Periconia macrospinosa]|uniref:Uncharacterized protein n=1 Tax=Periconia macrospinosa TaxID=97972 RepID=A0A2V1DF43_9PLEO|nr:hypothetical protein DM02DRAFT_658958 [Periconia macrospinosa]